MENVKFTRMEKDVLNTVVAKLPFAMVDVELTSAQPVRKRIVPIVPPMNTLENVEDMVVVNCAPNHNVPTSVVREIIAPITGKCPLVPWRVVEELHLPEDFVADMLAEIVARRGVLKRPRRVDFAFVTVVELVARNLNVEELLKSRDFVVDMQLELLAGLKVVENKCTIMESASNTPISGNLVSRRHPRTLMMILKVIGANLKEKLP
jgi:hypothetical protein